MPSPAEIAYRESVRALEGQATDLENIRAHTSLLLSAGGVSVALFGAAAGHGPGFWVAVVAFACAAAATIAVYWPVDFRWDFNGYQLVNTFVDVRPAMADDEVMRELAIHATDDYRGNLVHLRRLYGLQTLALVLFGLEVVALLANLIWE